MTTTTPRSISTLTPSAIIFAWRQAYRVVKHTATRTYLAPIDGAALPWNGHLNIGEPPAGSMDRPYFEHGTPSATEAPEGRRLRFVVLAARTDAEAVEAVQRIAEGAREREAERQRRRAELSAFEEAAERELEAALATSSAPVSPATVAPPVAPAMPAAWQAPGDSEETILARELVAEREAVEREAAEEAEAHLAAELETLAAEKREKAARWRSSGILPGQADRTEEDADTFTEAAATLKRRDTPAEALRLALLALRLNASVASRRGGEARRELRAVAMLRLRRHLPAKD